MRSKPRWARVYPYSSSEDDFITLNEAYPGDFEHWPLESCTTVVTWPSDASMSCTNLEGPRLPEDALPNHLGLLVVSDRARNVLLKTQGVEAAVQWLPVHVDYRGHPLGDYYVLHVVGCAPALAESSRVRRYTRQDVGQQPGSVKSIDRAVLQSYALKTAPPIFRLQEYPRWVLFGPEVREALEANHVRGLSYIELRRDSDEYDIT